LPRFLPRAAISTSTGHGIDADAKEAIAFAVLAHETWRRRPANLPSATGARHRGKLLKNSKTLWDSLPRVKADSGKFLEEDR
jgi:1,6-anhydro-N-acetylmuramate kinase